MPIYSSTKHNSHTDKESKTEVENNRKHQNPITP